MMAEQKGFVSIEKLREIENYNNWSWNIRSYLRNQGLRSTIVAPPNEKLCDDAKLLQKPTQLSTCT